MNTKNSECICSEEILSRYYHDEIGPNMQDEIINKMNQFEISSKEEATFVEKALEYGHNGVIYMFLLYHITTPEALITIVKSKKLHAEVTLMLKNTFGIQDRLKTVNVNIKMYKIGNLKMYNYVHDLIPLFVHN